MRQSNGGHNRVFSEEREYLNSSVNPTNDINSLTINVPDRLGTIQPVEKKQMKKLNPVAPPRRDASNSMDAHQQNMDVQSVNGSVFSISNSAHAFCRNVTACIPGVSALILGRSGPRRDRAGEVPKKCSRHT